MNELYPNIYKGFILSSIVAFILGFFSQNELSFSSYIAGYCVLTLSILMILVSLLYKGSQQNQTLYNILLMCGPFILMVSVIVFILVLMGTYKEIIIKEHISKSYHSFSNIFIILLLIQIYIVYTNISTKNFESTGNLSKLTSSIITLIGVLTLICSVIIFTILKYFTTDGFTINGLQ